MATPMTCPNCAEAVTAYLQPTDVGNEVYCPSCGRAMLHRGAAAELMREALVVRAQSEGVEQSGGDSALRDRIYEAIDDLAHGEREQLWTLTDILNHETDDVISNGEHEMTMLVELLHPDWPDMLTDMRDVDLRLSQIAEQAADDQRLIREEPRPQEAVSARTDEARRPDLDQEHAEHMAEAMKLTDDTVRGLIWETLRAARTMQAKCDVCGDIYVPTFADINDGASANTTNVWEVRFNHYVRQEGPETGAYCGGLGRLMGFEPKQGQRREKE